MGKEQCVGCGKELSFPGKVKPKSEWNLSDGSVLYTTCYGQRSVTVVHAKAEEKSVNYEGENVIIVQIPMAFTKDAWNKIDKLVAEGWDIKSVIEREALYSSLVILQKRR